MSFLRARLRATSRECNRRRSRRAVAVRLPRCPLSRSFKAKLHLPLSWLCEGMLLLLFPGGSSSPAAPVARRSILGISHKHQMARWSPRVLRECCRHRRVRPGHPGPKKESRRPGTSSPTSKRGADREWLEYVIQANNAGGNKRRRAPERLHQEGTSKQKGHTHFRLNTVLP